MNKVNGAMKIKRTKWVTITLLALLINMLAITIAAASPLTQPKADGLIGEQANGYIGLVTQNVSAHINMLIKDVNAKRKAGYQKIAAAQGISLAEVESVGGKKALEKTLSGNYVRDTEGNWRKK